MTDNTATPENESLLQGRAGGSPLRWDFHGKACAGKKSFFERKSV
jgi:hypothetical protein